MNVGYASTPLLQTIAHALLVSDGTAGLPVTVTQPGYVVGLALLVSLGDLLERRTLIAAMLQIAAAGLAVAAAAPGFAVFALAVAALGITAVVAQIVVAMSSSLAGRSRLTTAYMVAYVSGGVALRPQRRIRAAGGKRCARSGRERPRSGSSPGSSASA